MYYKKFCVTIIAFTIIHSNANAKKTKITKLPSYVDDESTPQPNVIAYSTFGFNDVGSYADFVPNSPEYANYINGIDTETTTRFYAPAFPTALESETYVHNYETQSFAGQDYNLDESDSQRGSVYRYPLNNKHFRNSLNIDNEDKNVHIQKPTEQKDDYLNSPEYGAKLNYKHKLNQLNNTAFNTYKNEYTSSNDDEKFNLPDTQPTHETDSYGESNLKYQNMQNFVPTYPTTETENYAKPSTENKQYVLNFPRVVDFTKMMQIHYPTAVENTPTSTYSNIQSENLFGGVYIDHNNRHLTPSSEGTPDSKNSVNPTKENVDKQNFNDAQGISYSYFTSHSKDTNIRQKPNSEYKKKSKSKHWIHNKNHTNDFKAWKDVSSMKGYEESKNSFNGSFNYAPEFNKYPVTSNFDEILTDSSNLIDFTKHQYNDGDFANFKKMPEYPNDNDYNIILTKTKQNDHSNQYKYLTASVPTATSYWGNVFKSNEYSPLKEYNTKKFPYNNDYQNYDNVVSITKIPNVYSVNRPTGHKSSDLDDNNHRPEKSSIPTRDWNKELFSKYKSEEDLLSLRNHDTSHSSYLPVQKPYENDVSENEYKNLLEKWKQSYLKDKYKNSFLRDYEAFGTETKPLHVPIPKPYPIEIPHPVIVPVPQPYPVRVPIAKPVAVPVVRELTVPIVKPVPYPVYKKVPYSIEKLVPVTVEKEVTVPINKPYPVHVPYVRPVFHHTKSMHDELDSENGEDDDYMPRPESSKRNVHYKRRPFSSNTRTRRPSRVSYHDRRRRFWPEHRRPTTLTLEKRFRRPYEDEFHYSKYQERDIEGLKEDHSAFKAYCKRKGNC